MNIDHELRQARKASRYAAMTDRERREKIHMTAWRCHCLAEGRRMVRQGQYGYDYKRERARV